MGKRRKRTYTKDNCWRNQKMVALWHEGKKVSDIARWFDVTESTVYSAIRNASERDNEIYNLFLEANARCVFSYTQAVVTRTYMTVCNQWPNIKTRADMANLSFDADMHITAGRKRLLEKARAIAKKELEGQ